MVEENKQLKLKLVKPPEKPPRVRLPDERQSVTHKFTFPAGDVRYDQVKVDDRILWEQKVVDFEGYVNVGVYDDGSPGEIFLTIGKAGDVWKAYDALMASISIGLQHGIPLSEYIEKLEHMRFNPKGITKNPNIPLVKSVPDYLAKWLKMKFVEAPNGFGRDSQEDEGKGEREGGTEIVQVREGGKNASGSVADEGRRLVSGK